MHWGHLRFVPEFNLDGKVVSVLAIGRDIHEIKENERRFRMLAENFPDIVIRFDRDGRCTYVNPAVEKAFGMPPETITAKTLQDIAHDSQQEQNDAFFALIRQALDNGIANESEMHWDTELGKRIYEIRNAPEKDATGNVVSVLSIARDITERKQMEEKLAMYREHLEELVRERTVQWEAANKELEAFAYSVSHDLRAPLRHIDGFIELLREKVATVIGEQSRHYMDSISGAAQKMGRLIDDLLSFSRTGRQAMAFQQVALDRELEPEAAGRAIEWHIGDLPTVEGDGSMLRIVLANLIANALKFSHPRHRAHIEIGSLPEQDGQSAVFVRDNGVGFDMTFADKLFGVFQRLHRTDEFEGTGYDTRCRTDLVARVIGSGAMLRALRQRLGGQAGTFCRIRGCRRENRRVLGLDQPGASQWS
jgi:PAS domain S-box-containing protein